MKVAYSGGEHEVNIGDVFTTALGAKFEVAKLTERTTYSPSSIGGTPVFLCKHPSGKRYPADWYDKDGLIEVCGDSIASALASNESNGDQKP